MNFETPFLIIGLELNDCVYMQLHDVGTNDTCISATVFKSKYDYQLYTFSMMLRGGEGGGPILNVIMTLIFKK